MSFKSTLCKATELLYAYMSLESGQEETWTEFQYQVWSSRAGPVRKEGKVRIEDWVQLPVFWTDFSGTIIIRQFFRFWFVLSSIGIISNHSAEPLQAVSGNFLVICSKDGMIYRVWSIELSHLSSDTTDPGPQSIILSSLPSDIVMFDSRMTHSSLKCK